jgi:hypothetical protein
MDQSVIITHRKFLKHQLITQYIHRFLCTILPVSSVVHNPVKSDEPTTIYPVPGILTSNNNKSPKQFNQSDKITKEDHSLYYSHPHPPIHTHQE